MTSFLISLNLNSMTTKVENDNCTIIDVFSDEAILITSNHYYNIRETLPEPDAGNKKT